MSGASAGVVAYLSDGSRVVASVDTSTGTSSDASPLLTMGRTDRVSDRAGACGDCAGSRLDAAADGNPATPIL